MIWLELEVDTWHVKIVKKRKEKEKKREDMVTLFHIASRQRKKVFIHEHIDKNIV